jgi:putative transcriptional regulator
MTAKTQAKSRIMGAVHVTARDLHAAGFIDTRRMRAYDAPCLAPVPDYSRERVRALRQLKAVGGGKRVSQASIAHDCP